MERLVLRELDSGVERMRLIDVARPNGKLLHHVEQCPASIRLKLTRSAAAGPVNTSVGACPPKLSPLSVAVTCPPKPRRL